MSKIIYVLTSSVSKVCESEFFKSYGISCYENGVETISYPDILPDKDKVQELVKQCNTLKVRPEHLPDVLEDFLP